MISETRSTTRLPAKAVELLKAKNFANFATIMPDGAPQVTPVWVDTDGSYVYINTAAGRLKERNVRRQPLVGLDVLDQSNPYSYVQIQGRVVEITSEGSVEHINEMHRKYHGSGEYPLPPGQQRVILKIAPEKVQVQ